MVRYVFKDDEPIRIRNAAIADPQLIGETIQKLADVAGDNIAKAEALAEAVMVNTSDHPLRKHFTEDVKKAAFRWWTEEARNLIQIVRVEDENATGGNVRAFVSIKDDRGTGYRPIEVVKKSHDLQLALLKAAERDLDAFKARYRELRDICDLVETARERVVSRRSKLETRAAA